MRWSLLAGAAALAFGCSSPKHNVADAGVPDAPMPAAEVLAVDGGQALVANVTLVFLGHLEVMEAGTATVIITNQSLTAVDPLTITPSPEITVAGCTTALAAGDSCPLTITARLSRVGSFSGSVVLTAGEAAGPRLVISVVGSVGHGCEFSVSPLEITLGNVQVGVAVSTAKIAVSARGAVTDLAAKAVGADVRVDETITTCTSALAEGTSCVVAVEFLATTVGSKRDEVTITACGSNGKVVTVPITATAVAQSPLVVAPSTPQEMRIDSPATFVITNAGNTPTGILALTVDGANAADFVTTTTCTVLAASATCSVTVVFAPAAPGQRVAVLTVIDTGPGASRVSVPLSGTGPISNPSLTITPSTSDLGKVFIGTTGETRPFTLTNLGNFATGTLKALISNPEIVITSDACTGVDLAQGGTCTVGVALKPATAGPKSGTLTVSGTISTPAVKLLTGTGLEHVDSELSPSSLDFDVVSVGTTSAPQTVTLRNLGDGPSSTLSLIRNGDDAAFVISENSCTGPLGSGATCSFKISFAPTEAGSYAATITVTDGTLFASVALVGMGYVATSGPLVISPSDPQTLASMGCMRSSPVIFTVTNVGTTSTGWLRAALSGPSAASFSATSDCTVLTAGSSCDVSVVYAPIASLIPEAASLTVTDSGPGAAMVAVALTGTPYDAPSPIITPFTSDFGTVPVGTLGEPVTFTVTSPCDACLGPLEVTKTGSAFAIVNDTCTGVELSNHGTCTVEIAFKPTVSGANVGTLTVNGTKCSAFVTTIAGRGFTLDAGAALDTGP